MEVDRVPVYRTCQLSDVDSIAIEKGLLLAGKIDFVLFTSNAEISSLISILGDEWKALNRTTVVCLSQVEGESAAKLGVKVDIVVEKNSPTGMVTAVVTAMEQYLRVGNQ